MPAGWPERRSDAAPPGLEARLRVPARSEHHLRRDRLLAHLDELVRAPVTLVVAPAGAGKTSLLVDWVSRTTDPVAWVALDETDVDVEQFWAAVVAALESVVPGLAEQRRAVLASSSTEPVGALTTALATVDGPSRAVLVLDDLPVREEAGDIIGSLRGFWGSMPDWLHVVLVSRRDPTLPLDRMRARGALAELRFADLRFTADEAAAMLERLVPRLPPQAVEGIAERSEGWAVSIQLGALVARSRLARGQDVMEPGEATLVVADFIWHEVLAAERPEVIELLTDLSVVARFGPGLLHALTDQEDPELLLSEAERHGLFLTRLDVAGWYEIHALVRQVLVAEAERREPGRVTGRHERAARWYADSGDVAAALDHWVRAGREREALRLLAHRATELYDSGSEEMIARVLTAIPASTAATDPEARLEYTWCLLLTDRRRFLEAVDQLGLTAPPAASGTPYPDRVRILEAISATMRGDWEAGARQAHRALLGLGEGAPTDWLGRFGWNMVARGVALSERWDDQLPDVVRARAALSLDPDRRLALEATRALGLALAGRPALALDVATAVVDDDRYPQRSILHAETAMAAAIAHRELGHRARAEAGLVELAEQVIGPVTYVQGLARYEVTRARLDAGDLAAAHRAFDALAAAVRSELAGPGGRDLLARAGTLVALADRDLGAAGAWADTIRDPFRRAANQARVHLAAGDRAAARGVLAATVPRTPQQEVVREVLMARAAEAADDAAKSLVRVVEVATSCGLLQTVASEGSDVVDMLERSAWLAPGSWVDRLRRAASRTAPAVGPGVLPDVDLTPRELEILRMLPSRLSVPEIAAELSISANTVKFHLKEVYRKLGVGSRQEAVRVARATRRPRVIG